MRRIMFILLLLAGGAIVNVAVAWGCYLFSEVPMRQLDASGALEVWRTRRPGFFPKTPRITRRLTGWGMDHSLIGVDVDGKPAFGLWWDQAGWPMKSCAGGHWTYPDSHGRPRHERFGRISFAEENFPIGPIWPGFAINTVFYAAIIWPLFAAPFALRRRRRIKHGLCVKCAYDLRGRAPTSATCPECGAAVIGASAVSIKDI